MAYSSASVMVATVVLRASWSALGVACVRITHVTVDLKVGEGQLVKRKVVLVGGQTALVTAHV